MYLELSNSWQMFYSALMRTCGCLSYVNEIISIMFISLYACDPVKTETPSHSQEPLIFCSLWVKATCVISWLMFFLGSSEACMSIYVGSRKPAWERKVRLGMYCPGFCSVKSWSACILQWRLPLLQRNLTLGDSTCSLAPVFL